MPSESNAIFAAPDHILFVREGSLFAQNFDVARLEVRGDARPVVERIPWAVAPWNLAAFSASRTGTLTYRLGGGSRTQFAWFDRAGRELGTVGLPGDYLSPALSPTETHLANTRRDDQPAGDIWSLDGLPRWAAERHVLTPRSPRAQREPFGGFVGTSRNVANSGE